jgi:hypothetical protein
MLGPARERSPLGFCLSPCYFWAHALALRAPGSWRAQRAAALWNENMPSKKSCKEVCGAAGMPLGVLGAPKPPALPAVGGGADAMSAGVSDEACRSQAFGIFGGLPGAAAMDTASPRSGQAPGVLWEGAANTTPEHEATPRLAQPNLSEAGSRIRFSHLVFSHACVSTGLRSLPQQPSPPARPAVVTFAARRGAAQQCDRHALRSPRVQADHGTSY